jgi:glycine cleavage system H protein
MSTDTPENLKYTEDHEWIDPETGWVGVTDYAQQQLGDIVFVELPDTGAELGTGDDFMIIESVKSVSDVYAPVAGTIQSVNEDVEQSPETVNESPYEDGKLVQFAIDGDLDHLMTADEYDEFTG